MFVSQHSFMFTNKSISCALDGHGRAAIEREEKKNWIGGHVHVSFSYFQHQRNKTIKNSTAARLDARGSVGVKVWRVEIHNILIIKYFNLYIIRK